MSARNDGTLFGHLAHRFSKGPEDLATEALQFLLARSKSIRDELREIVKRAGVSLPELRYEVQVMDREAGRPDLVGWDDATGAKPLIIEAKFWAGLTKNQPSAYLDLLPDDGGMLLFLAPRDRFIVLWRTLISRCGPIDEVVEKQLDTVLADRSPSLLTHPIGGGRILALTSWSYLLGALLARAEGDRQVHVAEDIRQLKGFCDRIDQEAFNPLRSEEMSSSMGRRVMELNRLVDRVAKSKGTGWFEKPNSGSAGSAKYYSRTIMIGGVQASLRIDHWLWYHRAPSPMWLIIEPVPGSPRALYDRVKPAQEQLGVEHIHLLARTGQTKIALHLRTEVEEEAVCESVVAQLDAIASVIASTDGKGTLSYPNDSVNAGYKDA